MTKYCQYLLWLVFAFHFVSCATTYHQIGPPQSRVEFYDRSQHDGLVVYYDWDVFRGSHNQRYLKKAQKKDYELIALKIVNNSGRNIVFHKDVLCYSKGELSPFVQYKYVKKHIKQNIWGYLAYLPITFWGEFDVNDYIIFSPGAIIAGFNMGYASAQNRKFRKDYTKYSLEGRVIPNGATVYGWAVYEGMELGVLKFVLLGEGEASINEKDE